MTQLILHIGYPKTGTTTLQKGVFVPLSRQYAIGYLGMFGFRDDLLPYRKNFFRTLTDAMYLESDSDFASILPRLQQSFNQLAKGFDPSLPLLLSNEHFTLSQSSSSKIGARIEVARTAQRLSRVFSGINVDIVLAIRRQDDLAWALFLENRSRTNHAHAKEYQDIYDFMHQLAAKRLHGHDSYNFRGVLAAYRAAFPMARRLVWTFEQFRDDPEGVVTDLLGFIGLETPDAFFSSFDLRRRNVKASSGKPPAFVKVPRLLRGATRIGHAAGLHPETLASLRRAISVLLPRDRAQQPDTDTKRAVRAAFSNSNANLATEYPKIANQLHKYNYIDHHPL